MNDILDIFQQWAIIDIEELLVQVLEEEGIHLKKGIVEYGLS